jgi:hypothetical protein
VSIDTFAQKLKTLCASEQVCILGTFTLVSIESGERLNVELTPESASRRLSSAGGELAPRGELTGQLCLECGHPLRDVGGCVTCGNCGQTSGGCG